jgi:hypothetical protein
VWLVGLERGGQIVVLGLCHHVKVYGVVADKILKWLQVAGLYSISNYTVTHTSLRCIHEWEFSVCGDTQV